MSRKIKKNSNPPVTPVININPFAAPNTSDDSFTQLASAQTNLSAMHGHLTTLVGALHSNPSVLGRLANFWGRQPLWLKAIGGILLFGSIITIGVLANVVMMIVVGSILAAGFIAGGLLLDNHYKVSQRSQANLEQGIRSLASVLEIIITALDKIREQLATEVAKFKEQNQRLSESVAELTVKVEAFGHHITHLSTTNNALDLTTKELARVTTQYEELKIALNLKVIELEAVKESMGLEITKLRAVGGALKGVMEKMSGAVLADEESQAVFKRKLEEFLSNSTASFDTIADRICNAESELVLVKRALEQGNTQYASLLSRYAKQVNELEKMTERLSLREKASATPLRGYGAGLTLFTVAPKPCGISEEHTNPRRNSIS